jgi:hypothetical protein
MAKVREPYMVKEVKAKEVKAKKARGTQYY